MARKWLNLFAGAALSFAVAGNALADEGKITVFAAASLTNAMQDIATQFKRKAWMWFLLSLRHLLSPVRLKRVRLRICLFLPIRNGWIMRLIKSDRYSYASDTARQ